MISTLLVAAALLAADPEPAHPPLTVKVGRDDTKVRVLTEENKTILDVVSPFGIDNAIVTRTTDKWPSPLIVRLHLKGLESLTAANYSWSVATDGESRFSFSVPDGGTVQLGGTNRPSVVRIVNSKQKIPLVDDGYFELTLPAMLFKDNPPELKLSWIDFYR